MVLGFRCDQWIRKIFIRTFFQRRVFRVLVFFWVGNFDAKYFFGSKISGLCIFWGLQYEAPSDPSVMYTLSTPLDTHSILIAILDWRRVPVFIKTLKNCAKQESVYFVIYPKQGPKMEAVVLNRVGILRPFLS